MNLDDLLVSQPSSGEEALRICETLVRSNALDVIVLDSVAALVTKAELEGEIGDATVGAQARLDERSLAQAHLAHFQSAHLCIFTNQIREKIGVMFGNPGDDARRQGAEILRQRPRRHPPHRRDQADRRHRHRQSHPRQSREEQSRAAVHRGGVRHHVQRRHFLDRRACSIWRWRNKSSRSAVPG